MNRPALIVSILLTALALTIVGGVVYSTNSIQKVQAAQAASQAAVTPDQASSAASDAAIDPQLPQTLLDREAAYQKMIAEANARLAQDQQTMQALQSQVAALQSPVTQSAAAPASAPASGVSPQKAAQIAAQYLGQSKIYSVETAAFNGANVFKVTFSTGDIVMVSLNGQVLAVQRAARNSSDDQVVAHFGEGEHEHEHEGGDD
jgi:hypothetical protein